MKHCTDCEGTQLNIGDSVKRVKLDFTGRVKIDQVYKIRNVPELERNTIELEDIRGEMLSTNFRLEK